MDLDPRLVPVAPHILVPRSSHIRQAPPGAPWTHVVLLEADGTPARVVAREDVLVEDHGGPEPLLGTVSYESGEPVPELWPAGRCVFVVRGPIEVPGLPFSDQ